VKSRYRNVAAPGGLSGLPGVIHFGRNLGIAMKGRLPWFLKNRIIVHHRSLSTHAAESCKIIPLTRARLFRSGGRMPGAWLGASAMTSADPALKDRLAGPIPTPASGLWLSISPPVGEIPESDPPFPLVSRSAGASPPDSQPRAP
jgi:hypothetical protein